jgi:hypothetical protein
MDRADTAIAIEPIVAAYGKDIDNGGRRRRLSTDTAPIIDPGPEDGYARQRVRVEVALPASSTLEHRWARYRAHLAAWRRESGVP